MIRNLLCFLLSLAMLGLESSALAVTPSKIKPWLRLTEAATHLKIDPTGHFLAYADGNGMGLKVTDLKTKEIFRISQQKIGPSFFFTPDGYRIFFRELTVAGGGKEIVSKIAAYDLPQHKTIALSEIGSSTSYLTFDPRDLRMKLLHKGGIFSRQISFPDERLAKWQASRQKDTGKWLVTQQGVLWITNSGYTLKKIDDDGSGVESFDIDHLGMSIVWATNNGEIYKSSEGAKAVKIGAGRDPKWHPKLDVIVYASSHKVGPKAVSYDIKLADGSGTSKYVTNTQTTNKRWPTFLADGHTIIYAIEGSTDLHKLDVKL